MLIESNYEDPRFYFVHNGGVRTHAISKEDWDHFSKAIDRHVYGGTMFHTAEEVREGIRLFAIETNGLVEDLHDIHEDMKVGRVNVDWPSIPGARYIFRIEKYTF